MIVAGKDLFKKFLEGIKSTFEDITTKVSDFVTSIVETVKGFLHSGASDKHRLHVFLCVSEPKTNLC